jgi:hypothetical protein
MDAHLTDEDAAKQIGKAYPDIGDRLLNLVQLKSYGSNALARASIFQRSGFLRTYEFANAVNLRETYRYWQWAAAIILLLALAYFVQPEIFRSSPERIINYNREFIPEAPFNFEAFDSKQIAFKNEDHTVQVKITGKAIPEQVYLTTRSRRIKMEHLGNQVFIHTFPKVQEDINYKFEAAGYNSQTYNVKVVNRPQLGDFNVTFEYPPYLNRKNERLENTGHFQVPEGTNIKWQIQPRNAEEVTLFFHEDGDTLIGEATNKRLVNFNKILSKGSDYEIQLHNEYSRNKEPIIYHAEVIPDNYPQINVNFYQDTVLYRFIMMSGNINDDHGISRLNLYYRIKSQNPNENFSAINIPIASRESSQSFNYEWILDSLNIDQGQVLQYFLQVWDNDGVNGAKASKTGIYTFKVPDKRALKEELDKSSEKTEEKIDKTLDDARELNKKIENANQRLKGRKNLNWQDEKQLKELINKREELNKALEELRKQHQNQEMKRDRFNPDENKKLKEKVEQLQELMDELLDEETKRLYEELQKLLENEKNMNKIQELLNQMQNKENNLEKELERTLELFKKLKFEHKLDQTIADLEKLQKEQEKLAEQSGEKENSTEETEEKTSPEETKTEKPESKEQEEERSSEESKKEESESEESSTEELTKQEELQEKFDELQKEMDEMQELNQDRNNPQSLPEDLKEQQENVEKEMKKAQEQLKNNKKNKANESQNKASEQMKKMKEQLSQMQNSMEMEMMMENLSDLRHIVHNLIKLSFDQEKLMKEFRDVQQNDPRFITLSQEQLKIMDDSRIIEDSLQALASRVFQIQSFVTRELSKMNNHLERTTEAIRERKKPQAVSEQQFAMTSMNNLALLLDDVLQQMQNAMAEAMGKPMPSNKKSDGPSLGELQQQLNQKIEGLKKSGKSGRELSEELAKLAAEQQRIREQLKEMQEKYGEGEKNGELPGNGIPEKMEETEIDLVNKKITEETIKRQKEILVRLLEAEKSMREREQDEERKGETANPVERNVPPSFEEYFKQKQQEIELLKTIPPKLFPYYRKEVNEYFKRIGNSLE